MGNGLSIHYWKDHWISGLRPLAKGIPAFANLDMEFFLKDMVMDDGTWNLDLFPVWVFEEVILRIVSIPPPYPSAGSDRIIWVPSSSGNFSIRGAYLALKQDSWNPKFPFLGKIWKYQGP